MCDTHLGLTWSWSCSSIIEGKQTVGEGGVTGSAVTSPAPSILRFWGSHSQLSLWKVLLSPLGASQGLSSSSRVWKAWNPFSSHRGRSCRIPGGDTGGTVPAAPLPEGTGPQGPGAEDGGGPVPTEPQSPGPALLQERLSSHNQRLVRGSGIQNPNLA